MDVGVDGVERHRHAERPGLVEQLVAGHDATGMAQQALEQRELARAQVDRCPSTVTRRRPSSSSIGPLTSRAPRRTRVRRGAAAQCPEACGQLLVGERLHEVVVGPGVEAVDPVVEGVARGEHQDPDARPGRAQASGHLETGHVGQADVEDHGVDAGRIARHLEAAAAVGRQLDDVAVVLEQPRQQPAEFWIVFDDEEVHVSPGVDRSRPGSRTIDAITLLPNVRA